MIWALLLHTQSFKISRVNVLLPFRNPESSTLPRYQLSVEGECVNWTSLNANDIRVIPQYESKQCSKSAVIEVLALGPKRKASAVIAETPTGKSLKCDVFIDQPVNISILTTTRHIYVEKSYEALTVQGRDSENNVFTSLEGLPLKFEVDKQYLKVLKMDEVSLDPKKKVDLVVKGKKIGKGYVKAFLYNLYTEADIYVVEPIALIPYNTLYVLRNTEIQFSLCSTRDAGEDFDGVCSHKMDLPSDYFKLSTEPSIIKLDQNGLATTLNYGIAPVTATDVALADNFATTVIHVVKPARIIQEEQWIALGDTPVFNPHMYSDDGHEIQVFTPIQWQFTTPNSIGRHEVTVSYDDFSFTAIVNVCGPIKITPDEPILPTNFNYQMQIEGGSGYFEYSVKDGSIISNEGTLIHTLREGKTLFIAKDLKISKYQASSDIKVSRIDSVEVLLEKREYLIGETLTPLCSIYATNHEEFTVPIEHDFLYSNRNFNSNIAIAPGFSDLTCNARNFRSKPVKVQAIAPLNISIKGIGAPLSKIPLNIRGGPQQWEDSPFPTIEVSCGEITTSVQQRNLILNSEYEGQCEATIQNLPSRLNPQPVKVSTVFPIQVKNVSTFTIHVVDKLASTNTICDSPPNKLSYTQSLFHNILRNRPLDVHVFPRTSSNDIISYYSAVQFELDVNSEKRLVPETLTPFFSSLFTITPHHSILLKVIWNDIQSTPVNLNILEKLEVGPPTNFLLEGKKQIAIPITKGSSLFSAQGALIENNYVVLEKRTTGTHMITVKDSCLSETAVAEFRVFTVRKLSFQAIQHVPVGYTVTLTLKVLADNLVPLPSELIEEAGIQVNATQTDTLTWEFTPEHSGKHFIKATSLNGVTEQITITAYDPIKVIPENATILPGEKFTYTIVNDPPPGLEFKPVDSALIRLTDRTVTGLKSGVTYVNISSSSVPMTPFIARVNIAKIRDLLIKPSSETPIKGGYVSLALKLVSDIGETIPDSAEWSIPPNLRYYKVNETVLFINCSLEGTFEIEATSCGFTKTLRLTIEPQLRIDPIIRIPPLSSITINQTGELTLVSDSNNSIKGISGSQIETTDHEGIAVLLIKAHNQVVPFTVKVSQPSLVHFYPITKAAAKVILADENGIEYASLAQVKLNIATPNDSFEAPDTKGYTKIKQGNEKTTSILTQASNNAFLIQEYIEEFDYLSISPMTPVLLRGASLQFRCTDPNPSFASKDSSVANITSGGIAYALKPGQTSIQCSPTAETTLTVVDLKFRTKQVEADLVEFEVSTTNDAPFESVIKDDFQFRCEWDCGPAIYFKREGKHFCQVGKCDRESLLQIEYASPSNISMSTKHKVPYNAKVNFGVEAYSKFSVKGASRKVTIPLKVKKDALKVTTPVGLEYSFGSDGYTLILRATDAFKEHGQVTLEHIASGEKLVIEVEKKAQSKAEPIYHKKEFGVSDDVLLYLTLGFLGITVMYILYKIIRNYF